MASFPYLDIAIGMCFIYLLMALVCSALNESIAGVLDSRGKTLELGILYMLHDPALEAKLYAHPLIQGVQEVNDRLPSYIASSKFALAMMDILTGPNAPANDPQALRNGVDSLEHSAAKTALTAVLQNPQFKTDQQRLEAWYEENMNRVSGWYKRTSQIRVFVLAAVVTLFMNADSLKVLRTLWDNPTMSAVLVEAAKARLQKGQPNAQSPGATTPANANEGTADKPAPADAQSPTATAQQNASDANANKPAAVSVNEVITKEEKQLLGQVTGWQGDWISDWPDHKSAGFWWWIWYLVKERLGGWVITILAVSLGAPFWFDTLSRFMNVRSSGNPPEKSAEVAATTTA